MAAHIDVEAACPGVNAGLFSDDNRIALALLGDTGDAGVAKADLAGQVELVSLGLGGIHLAFDGQVLDVRRHRIADDRRTLLRQIVGDDGEMVTSPVPLMWVLVWVPPLRQTAVLRRGKA